MKQLLTLIFAIISISAFSQYKNVNQKLNFVNGFKVGDTVRTAPSAIFGSGQFLKIQDTTAGEWTVIRSNVSSTTTTDTSFFNRSNNRLTPKNLGDSIQSSGLILDGLSGSGDYLGINQDGKVSRTTIDTSFFDKSNGTITSKSLIDTVDVSDAYTKVSQIIRCVGSANVDNLTGGFKQLFVDPCTIDTIFYTDTSSAAPQPIIYQILPPRVGTTFTLVGGFRANQADSSAVLFDNPLLKLNGNDTLKYNETITLFMRQDGTAVEISRSDNNN